MPEGVAEALAKRGGRDLLRREGHQVLVHPALAEAVSAWYSSLASTLDGPLLLLDDVDLADSAPESAPEMEPRSSDEVAPCSLFAWCDGHNHIFPEWDGCHMTSIEAGQFSGGEPKKIHVIRYLPGAGHGDTASWSFSMPEGGEWSIAPEDVDRDINEGIAGLELARRRIREFLAEHGEAQA